MRKLHTAYKVFDAAAAICIAVLIVWAAYAKFGGEYGSVLIAASLVLGGLVCSFLCDVLHEAGHLLFGKICNFSFNSVRVGFVKIYKKDGYIRVTAKELPESVAGATEMLPRNSEKLYPRFLWTVAGGLLFSFLAFAALFACFLFYRRLPFAVFALTCTGLPYAFHLFFYNLLPLDNDSLFTDGAIFWGLLHRDASYRTAVNILAVEGYLNEGLAPAEIDAELYFGLPQLPEDDINFIILTSYRLMYYLDADDKAKAVAACERLESLMEYVPEYYEKDIASDILFCECSLKGDAALAESMYPALATHLLREDTLASHRILAAYELYVNGDKTAALSHVNEAQKKAETHQIPGLVKYEKKLLARIRGDLAR